MQSRPDSREFARAALENAEIGFVVFRAERRGEEIEWTVVDANASVRDRWAPGVPVGPALQASYADALSRSAIRPTLEAALASGMRVEVDREMLTPSGGSIWRRVTAVALEDDIVAVVTHDIGDLVDARGRAAALSQHSSDIVAIAGVDGAVVWVSPAVQTLLGHSVERVVGRSAADLAHAADADALLQHVAQAVADPETDPTVEVRLRCADGCHRWFQCSITNRLEDPEVRGIVLSMHDIDDRRRSEDALRVSELRMRGILETAADAIITTDDDNRIVEFNRAAERIFGVAAADVLGTVYPDLLPESADNWIWEQKSVGAVQSGLPIDIVTLRADGVEFDARISVSRTTIDGRTLTTAIVRDVTDEKETARVLERRGLYDELTGLASRRLLMDRLSEALLRGKRRGTVVGLLLLDLDRFKNVNDSLGHDAGDALLVEVAGRLRSAAGEGNTVARLGGDEFVVLCDEARDIEDISDRAGRLDEVLRAPFVLSPDADEVMLTASIGIAVATGGDERADALVRHADVAMYRAKDRGRARIELFDERMQAVVSARLGLESALRRAVEREELVAYYQPIVAFATGRPTHLEALVRWQRPDRDLVAPEQFIGIAEETGLIHPIGEWMLHRAALDCARWQEAAPGVGVSVNVSPRQFESRAVVEAVAGARRDAGLPPALLGLEITESVLVDDPDATVALLQELKALGVRIALDDFGTGYSSLTYLQQLPIDELKIDRSFVGVLEDEESDLVLLRMMVQLGRAFDLKVVAEGIDTDRKLRRIRGLGCHFGQGYLFARPAPFEQVMGRFEATIAPVPEPESPALGARPR